MNIDQSIYTEDNEEAFIDEFNFPNELYPGEEVIKDAIVIRPHNNTLRISFLWGDKSIKVIGPHMITENIFEFPPDNKKRKWFLKFCLDKNYKIETNKNIYITVEEVIENKNLYNFFKYTMYFLIFLSFIPLFFNLLNEYIKGPFLTLSIFGAITIPIPILTIVSFVLLSKRIDLAFKGLSQVKITKNIQFREKAITRNMCLKTKIR